MRRIVQAVRKFEYGITHGQAAASSHLINEFGRFVPEQSCLISISLQLTINPCAARELEAHSEWPKAPTDCH
jgi:hypothetical protein